MHHKRSQVNVFFTYMDPGTLHVHQGKVEVPHWTEGMVVLADCDSWICYKLFMDLGVSLVGQASPEGNNGDEKENHPQGSRVEIKPDALL